MNENKCCCCGFELDKFSRPKPFRLVLELSSIYGSSNRICNKCRLHNYRKNKNIDLNNNNNNNSISKQIKELINKINLIKEENENLKAENITLSQLIKEYLEDNLELEYLISNKKEQIKKIKKGIKEKGLKKLNK
ncbi:hypothetical protein M0811_07064 [Anaeramoeba ignava]|uniref:Uncharacterized protein n=1 Tax=Anaeramoeba ignava TaxID=1746090 RepID=A0A9Q0R516_ANAIG|nr:hypothetical protein M0811_13708 [Anaeramoeba ignava]KAJ5075494.1 hypothetical protein M0811_07064 [Anaeramoeba ignava]